MLKFIDVHVHTGRLMHDRAIATPEIILAKMDEMGVEKSCLMAVETPEELDFLVPTLQILEVCSRYPDRFIPFCCIDPRHRYPGSFDPRPLLKEYVAMGCRGFGEFLVGLPINSQMSQIIYKACGEFGLPIMLHLDHHIGKDKVGLPGLERMLKRFPQTLFIGHGPHFWSEISADMKPEYISGYPKGPITPGGALDRLLTEYPNLYADISAGSGNNALSRDPAYAKDFLERHQEQVLFGSDFLMPGQVVQNADTLRNSGISSVALEKVGRKNAERILKL